MHPLGWIVWSSGAAIATMTTTNPFYLAIVFASAWIVHAAHHRTGPEARSFRIFLIVGVATVATRSMLVLLGPVTAGSLTAGFLEGLRLAVLLGVFGAFNSVADPYGVLKLAPRRFHEAALAAALALSIAPRTIASAVRVREAQRMRGIGVGTWRALPALAVPVLETGMEEAVVLAESMDARGHGRGTRSRYRPVSWGWTGVLTALSSLVGAGLFLAALVTADGSLVVSTFPLVWPVPSLPLIAGCLAFALPAFLPRDDV
ncbi:MAG: hypothetical protein ACLGIB_08260 [Actinomycetota bacterium]